MVQNFEFHNFWGSQKNEYVLGYKDFADFFFFFFFFLGGGGHHKIGLYLRVISMHLWYFRKVKVQNG